MRITKVENEKPRWKDHSIECNCGAEMIVEKVEDFTVFDDNQLKLKCPCCGENGEWNLRTDAENAEQKTKDFRSNVTFGMCALGFIGFLILLASCH